MNSERSSELDIILKKLGKLDKIERWTNKVTTELHAISGRVDDIENRVGNFEKKLLEFGKELKEPSPMVIESEPPGLRIGTGIAFGLQTFAKPSPQMETILLILGNTGEATTETIAKRIGRSRTLASTYLNRLADFYHYVVRVKHGKTTLYTLTPEGKNEAAKLKNPP